MSFHLPTEIVELIISKSTKNIKELLTEITNLNELDEIINYIMVYKKQLKTKYLASSEIKIKTDDVIEYHNNYYAILYIGETSLVCNPMIINNKFGYYGYFIEKNDKVSINSQQYERHKLIPIDENSIKSIKVISTLEQREIIKTEFVETLKVGYILLSKMFNYEEELPNIIKRITPKRIYFEYHNGNRDNYNNREYINKKNIQICDLLQET